MASATGPDEPSATIAIPVADEAALHELAAGLAESLPPRAFVTLSGDLGAGKTTLVKAVAAAAGLDPAEVVSPTFGLIHEHPLPPGPAGGPDRLVHADMYRLSGRDELAETGWDDAIAGRAWVFVEWPERIAAALPPGRLEIGIAIDSPTARTLRFTARGADAAGIVARLARR